MDSEATPLHIHKDPYHWLDMKWVLALLSLALPLATVLPSGFPWYGTTIAFVVLAAIVFWILTALRGRLRSQWIRAVIDNNQDVFFDMAMGIGEGEALGLWSDAGETSQMSWAFANYRSIRRQMLERLDVILPACSSVSEISAVIEAIDKESQSYSGLRQIRKGGFAEEFRKKGFGINV